MALAGRPAHRFGGSLRARPAAQLAVPQAHRVRPGRPARPRPTARLDGGAGEGRLRLRPSGIPDPHRLLLRDRPRRGVRRLGAADPQSRPPRASQRDRHLPPPGQPGPVLRGAPGRRVGCAGERARVLRRPHAARPHRDRQRPLLRAPGFRLPRLRRERRGRLAAARIAQRAARRRHHHGRRRAAHRLRRAQDLAGERAGRASG